MVYKRFYIIILVQLLLLATSIFCFSWIFQKHQLSILSINLGVVIAAQIVYLLHYINRINKLLMTFFDAYKFQDTSVNFKQRKHDKQFHSLYRRFDEIFSDLRELRAVQEKERFFYVNILNHIDIGVLVFDEKGVIFYHNKAVATYCGKSKLSHIENLNHLNSGFSALLTQMKPRHKEMLQVVSKDEIVQLSVRCSEIRVENELLRIISFQDIKYEIEQKEVEAWQKLIRIMIHEIMNSVSPVAFTTSGLIRMLEENNRPKKPSELEESDIDNIVQGLHAIRNRNKGLGNFVESYRSLNRVPQPKLDVFAVNSLFDRIQILMKDSCLSHEISFEKSVIPKELCVNADEKLVEQILINLIQNSMYALKEVAQKRIVLSAREKNGQVFISVTDNGKGLSKEQLEVIFVPFFTTKSEGSGIGLSVSREIMKLHGGYINVRSEPFQETVFTLVF